MADEKSHYDQYHLSNEYDEEPGSRPSYHDADVFGHEEGNAVRIFYSEKPGFIKM